MLMFFFFVTKAIDFILLHVKLYLTAWRDAEKSGYRYTADT